ncbi:MULTISPECIES: cupin domain-containing protein [Pseudovibrio]|uniref:cupin domain-containing protein n=1 Tax=Stappiaceae TaxID=2821832 RepID=UPI0023662B21|nr:MULTISPECIES: cupin domain-containing protein [Pseudovibrio]MDD7908866.1 cupin domain-containing protein [Pseudovibrio exalbescens]MDX5593816.1 cupin domain-containing protein [Pseudovibrio sp. SPO723]
MSASDMPIATLSELALDDWSQGDFFSAKDAAFGDLLKLKKLGIGYNEVQPGKSACPFHCHHNEEEIFVILEGKGTYRYGQNKVSFSAGDVLGAPTGGPETAHQIINTGSMTLKYLAIANKSETEVCEYPDSGKFQVTSYKPGGRLRHCGRESENHVNYWDGEA